MPKKSIQDLPDTALHSKNVLLRCDFNVPIQNNRITDDTRIRASLPTIQLLLSKGAFVSICSHFGRPKQHFEEKYSLKPVACRLAELLDTSVLFSPYCVGDQRNQLVKELKEGDVLLLENTRFETGETNNCKTFSQQLAEGFDLFVNDAFGSAHRAHASTEGVTKHLPAVAGLLLAKELQYLDDVVQHGETPMAAIVGGAKVSSKITVLNALVKKCDIIIIGGGMVFTFLKAKGISVGTSLVEEEHVSTAKEVLETAETLKKKLLLPVDFIVADKFDSNANTQCVAYDAIPEGWMGLDNGPKSTEEQRQVLQDCKTVLMNGPMGVFEYEKFQTGTFALVGILAELTKKGCVTIVGGGDSVSACEQSGKSEELSHISTGGGASLELLEGKVLPGVEALQDKCVVSDVNMSDANESEANVESVSEPSDDTSPEKKVKAETVSEPNEDTSPVSEANVETVSEPSENL